jgi:hypothetical protein
MFGSPMVPIGLFVSQALVKDHLPSICKVGWCQRLTVLLNQWYAWAAQSHVHWIVPVLAGLPVGWGTLTGFLSTVAYLVDVYGTANSASAMAANGTLRFALGAAFPQFIIQVYQSQMGIHWAGSIFAFISIVITPLPWFFFYRGHALRRRSHYAASTD